MMVADARRSAWVGCAGWRIPKGHGERLGGDGTHLQRYAAALPAVEINTSFYREHRTATYAKWADETPEGFRFAVKVPRWITHTAGLRESEALTPFLEQVQGLGGKLGPLLLQLPPRLAFDRPRVAEFLAALRTNYSGPVVCEPRHPSWLDDDAERLLAEHRVARAAVDPERHPGDGEPGGWPGLRYCRLHGSPRRFYSAYEEAFLAALADRLREWSAGAETWCVFNNTASEAGMGNALDLHARLAAA